MHFLITGMLYRSFFSQTGLQNLHRCTLKYTVARYSVGSLKADPNNPCHILVQFPPTFC